MHAHLFLYDFGVMTAEAIPSSMVGKLLIGRDFATQEEGGVRLSHSDTRPEISDSVDGTAFPRSSDGNQLT